MFHLYWLVQLGRGRRSYRDPNPSNIHHPSADEQTYTKWIFWWLLFAVLLAWPIIYSLMNPK